MGRRPVGKRLDLGGGWPVAIKRQRESHPFAGGFVHLEPRAILRGVDLDEDAAVAWLPL
jgi:hypothetical protein